MEYEKETFYKSNLSSIQKIFARMSLHPLSLPLSPEGRRAMTPDLGLSRCRLHGHDGAALGETFVRLIVLERLLSSRWESDRELVFLEP